MEQLNELEKRILDIVQKNKEMRAKHDELAAENTRLQEQCKQLESSLMNESKCAKTLEGEKDSIKTTIEELLNTISSLEAKSQ